MPRRIESRSGPRPFHSPLRIAQRSAPRLGLPRWSLGALRTMIGAAGDAGGSHDSRCAAFRAAVRGLAGNPVDPQARAEFASAAFARRIASGPTRAPLLNGAPVALVFSAGNSRSRPSEPTTHPTTRPGEPSIAGPSRDRLHSTVDQATGAERRPQMRPLDLVVRTAC